MKTRALAMAVALGVCAAVRPAPARATSEEQLQNLKGEVRYQLPGGAAQTLPLHGSVAFSDQEYVTTGSASLAEIGFPDGSTVLVGAGSNVRLLFSNEVAGNTARFAIAGGNVRFTIPHGSGARSAYAFETPAATITAGSAQGDIAVESDGSLRVNVYELCIPGETVDVLTKSGEIYQLFSGQSLSERVGSDSVETNVDPLTQSLVDLFSPDFGVPPSWSAANGHVIVMTPSQRAAPLETPTPDARGVIALPTPLPVPIVTATPSLGACQRT
jgi:ferric-dicitrate binding protein FerR (iron transport regulator)